MKLQDFAAVLHQMRGALSNIVMAMMFINKPVTRLELVSLTGYSEPTLRSSVARLVAMGMIKRTHQGDAWLLTEKAQSLHQALSEHLREPSCDPEEKNISYDSSSRSDPDPDGILDEVRKTRTTHEPKDFYADAPPLADAALVAVRILSKAGLARHTDKLKGAEDSVRAALDAGWSAERILRQVRAWMAYAESARGGSVRHPAFLAAARIRDLQDAPRVEDENAPSDGSKYISGKYGHLIEH